MNDRRFIELLNLYVDHQLEAEEACELEKEVMGNPARRRTYDQYCQLHRGCCLLGDSARSLAPSTHGFARALQDAERKIAAPRRSAVWGRSSYAGAFTATAAFAACLAVVLVLNRPSSIQDSTAAMLANVVQPAAGEAGASTMIAAVAPVTPEPTTSFDLQPVLEAVSGLGIARNAREAEIAASDREALEWMQRVELLPIQRLVVDEQAFESRPTLQQDNRVFRSRHSVQGNAEFAAFQFQR